MKLGIFDSGLGGLSITKAIRDQMPDLDIVYFGDTLHLPYGNRSDEVIFQLTKRAVEFLFEQDCALVIIACNTASARALRRIQQDYLPTSPHKARNVLGVIVPTLEEALEHGFKNLGLIGTNSTVHSNIYPEELAKLSQDIRITQVATPLLVPLIENGGERWLEDVLRHYLSPLIDKKAECILLACTHYGLLEPHIRSIMGQGIAILSQNKILPPKLADYLRCHLEYSDKISRGGQTAFYVSDLTPAYEAAARAIYGSSIAVQKAVL